MIRPDFFGMPIRPFSVHSCGIKWTCCSVVLKNVDRKFSVGSYDLFASAMSRKC